MEPVSPAAAHLVAATWLRAEVRMTSILAFREVARIAGTAGKIHLHDEEMRQMEKWYDSLDGVFAGPLAIDIAKAKQYIPQAADYRTTEKFESYQRFVDAASLIFAHSVLDAVVFDYCELSAGVEPRIWVQRFANRSLKIADVQSNVDEAVNGALLEHVRSMERSSLLEKTDSLIAACKPTREFFEGQPFTYDRPRLELLDRLRHDYVHKLHNSPLPHGDQDIVFLAQVAQFLMRMLDWRWELQLKAGDLFDVR